MDNLILKSTEEDSEYIHSKLQDYNSRYMYDFEDYSYHIKDDGRVVAGIVAESTFDTLEVSYLFVEETYRGKGLGQKLLFHIEKEAKKKGIKRVFLNTYSFQAPEFYKKLGYKELYKVEPAFDSYTQFYFVKNL